MQKVVPQKIIYIQQYNLHIICFYRLSINCFFLIFKNQLFAEDFLFYESELV